MQKYWCLLILGLGLAWADPTPTPSPTSGAPKDELGELLTKLEAVSPRLTKAHYTVLHIEFDRLSKDSTFTLKRSFQHGHKYKVVGVGGKGIVDLRLHLLDAKGKLVATDQGTDSVSIVNVVPKSDASYTLKVSAAKADSGLTQAYFFCLIASKPQ